MEKIYYLIILTVSLTVLMQLAGITYTGQIEILNWLGMDINNFNPKTSDFYLALTAPIVGLFIVGAAVGAVASQREASLRAGMAGGILGVGAGAFVGILLHIKNVATGNDDWIFYLVFLIFSVYIVAYILAALEWWSNG